MKAVIHIGAHKTATTSFQLFLNSNRDQLKQIGIYFHPGDPGNHRIAHEFFRGNYDCLRNSISNAIHALGHSGVFLLTSEDFEGLLVQGHSFNKIISIFNEFSIHEIYWVFVYRDPYKYFLSLYSELSKHSHCLNFLEMAKSISSSGVLIVPSRYILWKFVFNYQSSLANLPGNVSPFFCCCSLTPFIACSFPGQLIIDFCLLHLNLTPYQCGIYSLIKQNYNSKHIVSVNRRQSPVFTELRYARLASTIASVSPFNYLVKSINIFRIVVVRLLSRFLCHRRAKYLINKSLANQTLPSIGPSGWHSLLQSIRGTDFD